MIVLGKDLVEASGLSPAAISRYINGERIPNYNSKEYNNLLNGLILIAKKKKKNVKNIKEDFIASYGNNIVDFNIVRENLNNLIKLLNLNISKLANKTGFDSSYISKICSGNRTPSNKEEFVELIAKSILELSFNSNEPKKILLESLNIDLNYKQDDEEQILKLKDYLFTNHAEDLSSVGEFLSKLDDFNLGEFIKTIHFDELKIPSIPFQFSVSKNYYGIKEMRNGELDFFKQTVLSKTKEPIFMYNDMSMEEMAKDVDFGKKWMFAIAMSLKKGLHLNIIHNLNRPFNELMLGLESWIPIYMTGQVSPYFFKTPTNEIFNHTLYVSEVASLVGEGINGNRNNAKYYLTNKKNELPFYQTMAKDCLKKASPLMDIYTNDNLDKFDLFIKNEKKNKENKIVENKNLNNTFKNISFTICKNNWVAISKQLEPTIHFVIHHPILCSAIENFIAPVVE